MGGVALAAKGMIGHLKEQVKAAHDYRDAVLKYGKGSEEAATKLGILQHVTKGISPEALKMVKGFAGVREEWEKLTKPSRKPFFSIAEQGLKTIKGLMPEIATETNKTFAVLAHSIDPILKELRGSGAKGAIGELMGNFRAGLPDLIRGLANVGKGIGNIAVEASQFLPELNHGFKTWSETFANETGTTKFKGRLDEMIRQAGDLLHLFHVAGQAILLFFGAGAEAGDNMTKHLSRTIERWNDWMRSIEGQESLHSFFDQSSKDTENFFGALVPLLRTFTELARALQPVTGGMLAFARVLSEVMTALARIPGMTNILKAFGVVIGTAFVVGKIQKWSAAIRGAAEALGILRAAEVATAETGAVAAGASATAAGGAGLAGGGAMAAAGTAAGTIFGGAFAAAAVVLIGEELRKALGAERSDSLWKGSPLSMKNITEGKGGAALGSSPFSIHLPGEDKLLGNETTKKFGHLTNTIEVKWNKMMGNLRASTITGMVGINGALRNALNQADAQFADDPPKWRAHTVEAMRAAVKAIKDGMAAGLIPVKQGKERIAKLLGEIKFRTGSDPVGVAEGMAKSFARAGQVTHQGVENLISRLQKMPPKAADTARDAIVRMTQRWAAGHPKLEKQVDLLNQNLIASFGSANEKILASFGGLADGVSTALGDIASNLNSALSALGAGKATVAFGITHGNYSALGGKYAKGGKGKGKEEKQQGGFTVGGSGSGDKVPAALPYGSFVMNREASKAYGFTAGGAVQTILEPRERVFLPHEVARIGPHNLAAMNAAVPRQKGGSIGPEPQIGGAGALHDVGQGSIHKAYAAAEKFFNAQKAKFSSTSGGYTGPAEGPAGTSMYKGVLMATWVRQALEYGAAHGSGDPQPTSGYRSHAQNVSEGRNYTSEHEFTQYPGGAVDFGGMVDPGSRPLKMAVVNATRNFRYPLLAPVGFRDDGHASGTGHMRGGFIEALMAAGGFTGGGLTVKHTAASASQINVGEEIMRAADASSSPHLARVASMMAGIQENTLSSSNTFQLTGAKSGSSPGASPYDQAIAWFTEGFYSKGGGNALAAKLKDPGAIAQAVEGSAHPSAYSPWKAEAQHWVDSWRGSGTVAGAAGATAHKALPKEVEAKKVTTYAVRGGNVVGVQRDVKVPLDVPEFGPIPDDEHAVRKELAQISHHMLPEYRAALAQHKAHKQIAEHLTASIKKIEARITALRDKLRELRYAKARKRFSKKTQRQLGKLTGQEGAIEAAKRRYEEREEFAQQVVGQEPEENGEITPDWLERVFEPYINGQERPAYEAVLGAENVWRNTVLGAESVASGIEKNWEALIGYPEKNKKPELLDPNLHWPPRQKNQRASGLADWIYGLKGQIDRIRAFASSHDGKWWSEHPAAKQRRDDELRSIDTYFKPQMDFSMARRRDLITNLGEGRGSFNWFAGTGAYEESMQDVQGLHWPDQHGRMDSLPGTPVPGVFGGAIYDTQEAIQDLGIKIQNAKESLSSGEGPDRAGELKAFEEAIRGLMAGRPFLSINQGPEFMGAFARGGVALVGERGPELAHMPSGTRIHDAEDTARLLEPQVVVDLSRLNYGPFAQQVAASEGAGKVINVDQKNYFPTPPPDPHTWARGQVFELEAIA
jgi:hypothetical protein